RERLEHAEHVIDPVRSAVFHRQFAHRPVQRGRQRPTQLGIGTRLDLARSPAAFSGHGAQLAEQHGLSDTTKAGQHETALRSATRDTFQHHVEGVQFPLSSRHLRWTLPRARREGIPYWIHVWQCIARSSANRIFRYTRLVASHRTSRSLDIYTTI